MWKHPFLHMNSAAGDEEDFLRHVPPTYLPQEDKVSSLMVKQDEYGRDLCLFLKSKTNLMIP